MQVDLNCDLGESFGRYRLGEGKAMLRVVTSANVACGLHAGDPPVMQQTVRLAGQLGVAVGAHPGYPDLQGFGRRAMALSPDELEAFVLYQLGALEGFARAAGVRLAHVKPHGAMYNTIARDPQLAAAVVRAAAAFDPHIIVVTLPGSAVAEAARALGLPVALEGFADRAYQADGTLVPRSRPGALIPDPTQAAERAVRMITRGEVETIDGQVIALNVHTLCIHGDTPGAVRIAAGLREALEDAGIEIAPMGKVLGV